MRQSNVVPMPQRVPMPKRMTFSMPLHKLDSFEGIKAISKLMREWERGSKEHTFKLLAQRAGLCRETVSRIASRTTMAPRLHTVLAIMGALGFTAVRFE